MKEVSKWKKHKAEEAPEDRNNQEETQVIGKDEENEAQKVKKAKEKINKQQPMDGPTSQAQGQRQRAHGSMGPWSQ